MENSGWLWGGRCSVVRELVLKPEPLGLIPGVCYHHRNMNVYACRVLVYRARPSSLLVCYAHEEGLEKVTFD